MASTYLVFDFGPNEEGAQRARHKLEGWKQAFRLDKRLLFKFDRSGAAGTEPPAERSGSKGKGKGKVKPKEEPTPAPVKLLVRLYFSDHEKLSEQRWIERIPNDEHFRSASPKVVRPGEVDYASLSEQFDFLD